MNGNQPDDRQRKGEADAEARAVRLKAALQANIARRKGQARARAAREAGTVQDQEDGRDG